MTEEEVINKVLDTIYDCYKLDNDMDKMRFIHPMFYNGSFSEHTTPTPQDPKPLMEKEEFLTWVKNEETEWSKAMEVLTIYIMRNNHEQT